jgi:hypothetical protein
VAYRAALEQTQKGPYAPADRAEARVGLCRALLLRGAVAEAAREAEAALAEAPELEEAKECRAKAR